MTTIEKLKKATEELNDAQDVFEDIADAMVETNLLSEPVKATELADNIRENSGAGDYEKLKNKPTIGTTKINGDIKPTLDGIYAKKSDIPTVPTKMSQLTNDSGYIKPTSSSTSTKEYYEFGTSSIGGVVIYADEANGGNNSYIKINENNVALSKDVPTKVSDLTNDAGYLSSIPIADDRVLGGIKIGTGFNWHEDGTIDVDYTAKDNTIIIEDATTGKGKTLKANLQVVATLSKVTEVEESIPTKTSDLTNDSRFVTQDDIPAVPTKVSELENDSGYIKSDDIPTSGTGIIVEDGTINIDQDSVPTFDGTTINLGTEASLDVNGVVTKEEYDGTTSVTIDTISMYTDESDHENDYIAINDNAVVTCDMSDDDKANIILQKTGEYKKKFEETEMSGEYDDGTTFKFSILARTIE